MLRVSIHCFNHAQDTRRIAVFAVLFTVIQVSLCIIPFTAASDQYRKDAVYRITLWLTLVLEGVGKYDCSCVRTRRGRCARE